MKFILILLEKYINDIFVESSKNTKSFRILCGEGLVVFNELHDHINCTVNWMISNKFNCAKIKLMFIDKEYLYNKFNNPNLCIIINNNLIEEVQNIKYLGIFIDRKLILEQYVGYLCKKIAKTIEFMARISKKLYFFSKLIFFNTIIFPHFFYDSSLIFFNNVNMKERF